MHYATIDLGADKYPRRVISALASTSLHPERSSRRLCREGIRGAHRGVVPTRVGRRRIQTFAGRIVPTDLLAAVHLGEYEPVSLGTEGAPTPFDVSRPAVPRLAVPL